MEKPDRQTAEKYLKANEQAAAGCGEGARHFWNVGIFCFRLKDMVSALVQAFGSIPSKSIDYSVMERAKNIACVFLDALWTDAGSWDSLYESLKKDESGNATESDVLAIRAANSLLVSRVKLLCAAGVDGIIAVGTPDALFITSRGSSQNARDAVDKDDRKKRGAAGS